MKHIFLVHSPVTFLVSVSVIDKLKLSPDEAIVVFYQFKKLMPKEKKFTVINIDEFYQSDNFFIKVKNYLRYFNIAKRIDRMIDDVTQNENYVAYIPSMYFMAKIICTNKLCVSFNFIEEGLLNYYKEETLFAITAINAKDLWRSSFLKNPKQVLFEMYMVLRGYNFRLQGLPFSYSCYNGVKNILFYRLSEDAFPLIGARDKKTIVPFDKNAFAGIDQKVDMNIDDQFIWIGDAGVQLYGFSEIVYLQGILEGCIHFLKAKKVRSVLIKFHRDEPSALREKVKKLFAENNISYQTLPDSTVMELLLFNAKNVTLIGIYSSLLYYASIMGHKAFSIYHFIQQEYSKALAGRDFNFYWNKVKLIEPAPASVH